MHRIAISWLEAATGTKAVVSEDIQGRVTRKVCLACNREFTGIVKECPHDGTVLVALAQDQFVGTKLADRYHILSVIGHGGMGVVYKARHELMDRIVAIKMLQQQLISDSMSVKRFQQEAKAASRLKHPNVITLYDFGVSPTGQPYLVMDYLDGNSLSDVIKNEGKVGVDRCIKVFTQACDALQHAHHQGVVHRDLKPGNIMLVDNEGDKDFVKVVDFGVAKLMPWAGEEAQRLTQTGEVCGSPVYMSPEQCMGQKLDNRSDIYSMGVVVYESLTGQLPLLGKTMVDTMSKHISEMPSSFNEVRPDIYIPDRLERIVFKALQKSPDDRYQSMGEFAEDLQRAVPKPGKSQVIVALDRPEEVLTSQSHALAVERKFPIIIIVAVALILLAGGIWYFVAQNAAVKSTPAITVPPPIVQPPVIKTPAVSTPAATAPAPVVQPKPAPVVQPTPAPRPQAQVQPKPAVVQPAATPAPISKVKPSKAAIIKRAPAAVGKKPSPSISAPASDPYAELRRRRSY